MTKNQDYNWIELATLLPDSKMIRNQYINVHDNTALSDWRDRFENTDVFSSIAVYTKPDNESLFVAPLFFDIDSIDDLAGTRQSALALCHILEDRANVPLDMIEIFFSGCKGFHVLVPCRVFGAISSVDCLILNKRMAEKAEEAGIHSIDKSVYTYKRVWRLPNSRNSKSGLFKIPLSYEELRDMDIHGIQELAQSPRPENTCVTPKLIPAVATWYRQALECIRKKKNSTIPRPKNAHDFKQGWRKPPCIRQAEKAVIPEGIRHNMYVHLARYYAWLGMHPDGIEEEIHEIDLRNPVEDPDSITRAVKAGCKYPGFPGCDNHLLKKFCELNHCFLNRIKTKKGDRS